MKCLRKHSGTNAKRQIALFLSDHSFVSKLLKIVCATIPPVYVRSILKQKLQRPTPIEFLVAVEIFKTFFREIIAALFLRTALGYSHFCHCAHFSSFSVILISSSVKP